MNKYQESLKYLMGFTINDTKCAKYNIEANQTPDISVYQNDDMFAIQVNALQELVDRTTPKKPIKLEIIDLDEIIMPEYTNTIDKYMCDNCGLTWFIVDGHTYQHKYCKQCGQAIDWSNDE